jgi:CheY-like chemotaxis protein
MTIKLLVIEDLKKHHLYFKGFYQEEIAAGVYEFIFTEAGEEALEIINSDRARELDLIIADLKMPAAKVDGWQFIKTLARNSIDLKIIVITAWGKLNDFSEEERKNIVYFIDRNTEEDTFELLTDRINLIASLPDRFTKESQKVRFNTLLKAAKDLPSQQKIKLVKKLINYSNLKELKQFQAELPVVIEESIDEAIDRDLLRKWLLEKERSGELKLNIPVRELEFFYIDIKKLPSGNYYDLRYWHEGSLRAGYIPKHLEPELLQILETRKFRKRK